MSLAEVKKGEKVALIGFTGIRLTDVEVTAVSKTEIKCEKKDGSEMVFSKKTGVQTNAKNEKYANSIMTLEDAPENKERKKPVKKDNKKAGKKGAEIEDVTDEEEEEIKDTKKKKEDKKVDKKADKKKKKPEPEYDDDEDDEDDFEEI
jgi:hypothetical protein